MSQPVDDFGDGWCLECGDTFRLDDMGGYNPPCECKECQGMYCRNCCREDRYGPEDDDERPEDSYPKEPV
jgi:hypothetical protein